MKEVITNYELELLDAMATAALKVHEAAQFIDEWEKRDAGNATAARTAEAIEATGVAIGHAFRRLLLVGRLELDKRLSIEHYIASGARTPIETFLEMLGVAVADPLLS